MADLPPAGWFPDPDQPGSKRYWDGQAWTDQRAPASGKSATPPLAPAGSAIPPGWYSDPEQADTRRYWDGKAWTDQRAPAEKRALPSGEILFGLGAAILMGIGAIGPWVTVPFASKGGLDGDGVIVLVAAIAGGIAVATAAQQKSGQSVGAAIAALVAGLAGAATAIYDIADIYSRTANLLGETVRVASPGWGLWLSAVASVGLAVASFAIIQLAGKTRRAGVTGSRHG